MKIVKSFETYTTKSIKYYGVVYHTDDYKSIFINTDNITEEKDSVWVNIDNLLDESFLKEHNIDYIIEDENVIPIGIVDFVDNKYYSEKVCIWNHNKVTLYKANQILKNIDRAIEIKYEAIKFVNKFNNTVDGYNNKKEELEL
ncbi:hypothetical protein [Clostridium arbusti]|uniref:hypothetical protein n=1 Tax=Clostridium arbusti TaxID=1137848 RepID=UPI000289B224|nr:hypothetical protein [Clostridium arbusti]